MVGSADAIQTRDGAGSVNGQTKAFCEVQCPPACVAWRRLTPGEEIELKVEGMIAMSASN
jgi:hypothetical protein